MSRLVVALAVFAVLGAAAPGGALVAQETTKPEQSTAPAPGAQLSGVVGVQGSEVRGEVEERSLDRQLAAASDDRSRAAVVADQAATIEERLAALRERRASLREAYRAGEIPEAVYRARLATLAAQIETVERRADRTTEAASALPADALGAAGVDVEAVRGLARNASDLGDGDVAEAAKQIAGEGVGQGLGDAPRSPNGNGPPDDDPGPPDDDETEEQERETEDGDDDNEETETEDEETETEDEETETEDEDTETEDEDTETEDEDTETEDEETEAEAEDSPREAGSPDEGTGSPDDGEDGETSQA